MGKIQTFADKNRKWLLLLFFAAAVIYPLVVPTSYLRGVGTKILMYCIFAGSLNIINGYSGMFTLGHAGFICIGAYTSSLLLTKLGVNFWFGLIAAGCLSAIVGYLLAYPTRKLNGLYLTIVTLGFGEIIRIVALNWTSFTGGAMGIKAIAGPSLFGFKMRGAYWFYYIALVLLIVMLLCTYRILRSRVGRAWIAIRENQTAAASLGVNIVHFKGMDLLYGAFWAGVMGAFQASYMQFIDPTMYSVEESFNIISMTIVGGLGTLAGPIVGSVVITLISEVFRFAAQYRMIIYALLIISMMWLRPQGIAGARNSAMVANIGRRKKKTPRSSKDLKEGSFHG